MRKIFEYFSNEDFYNDYIDLLVNRITHSSMSLEDDLGNVDDVSNAIKLKDSMMAFKRLLRAISFKEDLSLNLITLTADTINKHANYISNGYRKIGRFLAETNISISNPENIERDLSQLLYRYNGIWKELDSFEREARFHIEFIRIHPYEDGNGRTGRFLTNFNLLRNGFAPIVITEEQKEYYQSCIRNYDIIGMKKLFEIQSKKEEELLEKLYQNYQEYEQLVSKHI